MAMRKALVIALMCAVLPSVAAAQTSSSQAIDEVRKESRMHVGPFYMTPTILMKEFGMDTNVFNQVDEQKKDFTFTLTPKANVWVPFARRALFTTTAAADIVWYAKYGTERSVNPQFTARGEVYLNRITIFAENAYLNTRQRPNYEIDLRSRHLENDASVGGQVKLTPKFSVEAAAVRGITRYEADAFFDGTSLRETLNRDTTGFRTVARHRATPLTTVAVRYERMHDRFPFSPSRDSDSYRLMPGLEFKSRALINGSAYVGYRRFTPRSAGDLPEFSGLVSQLGLSYTLLGSTTFGVSYRRDLTYSYETLQPFFVNDSAGVSMRRAVGGRFDLLVSADRHKYSYQDLLVQAPGLGLTPERIDTTWNYAGSIGYRVGRDGRVGVGVSYYDRQSTTRNFRAYNGLRIGSVFTFGL
jgi:putative beta-barrel porin BBP2